MTRIIRLTMLVCLIISVLAAAYCAWGLERGHRSTMVNDPAFPREHPYPDHLILWLNDWYEQRAPPAPEGMIKMHGELPRVHRTLWVFRAVFVGSSAIWLVFGLAHWWFHRPATRSP